MDLIDYHTAAGQLGVSVATARRLVRRGELIAYRITAHLHRVDAASIRAYLRRVQIAPIEIDPSCPSGRIAGAGAGASCVMATRLREALEHAKQPRKPRPQPFAG